MAGGSSKRGLGEVHRLFALGVVGTMSDAQLLDRYVAGRDEAAEAAFEELVIRHAPMVLQVCRHVLRDAHDAEDAFQATFLVLASRAGSIRRAGSIASWLFGVARRVATRSRRAAARRRTLDRRGAERNPEGYLPPAADADREAVHEEIEALPDRLREPVVLCYLQGATYAEAAHHLRLSEVALRGRLARGRDRLRRQLARRGVTTAPAGLLVAGVARVAVPTTLTHSTVRIAMGSAASHTAGVLARGVLGAMLLQQCKVASVLFCLGVGASYSTWRAAVADDEGGPTVTLVRPPARTLVREVGGPSFVEASRRTPIYPERIGYITKPVADIGDRVKQGDVLATLIAPGRAPLDEGLEQARASLELAAAEVEAARARLAEARAIVAKHQAEFDRWDVEVKRLEREVKRGVVDPQVLSESANQRKASEAALEAARATVTRAEAELQVEQTALAKAKVDVSAAKAASERERGTPSAGSPGTPASRGVEAARARLAAARAVEAGYEVDCERWDAELKRLGHTVDATKAVAAREAIRKAEADVLAYRAAISKARVEASVAAAALAVAESEPAPLGGSPTSFSITAPHDGLIVARNANVGDLARPAGGPPANAALPPRGPEPLYVVDQVDVVRVLIDIPEPDAAHVNVGAKASVLVKADRDRSIEGTIVRVSRAPGPGSRAFRAEVDLPNPDGRLKPGMSAYGKVVLGRPVARALPVAAVTTADGRSYCWIYDHGRAARTEVETGSSDGRWVEVIRRRAAPGAGAWVPIDGSEPVILGDLRTLQDRDPVEVAPEVGGPE